MFSEDILWFQIEEYRVPCMSHMQLVGELPICPNVFADDDGTPQRQKHGRRCPWLETPACARPSQPSFPPLPSTWLLNWAPLPIQHSSSSDVARPTLLQPQPLLIIDHSAGISSTLGLAGGPLINNLVRVMDSVRIIA